MSESKIDAKFCLGLVIFFSTAKIFSSNKSDPDQQGIANDFTPEMFTATGIEVLGTPIGTDAYIKDFVAHNCIKIIRDVEKLESLTDVFTYFQLVQKTMKTHTQ
jgi:hypothetical protein